MKLKSCICAVVLAALASGCQTSAQVTAEKIHNVEVYRGSKDANPDKRTLTKVGRLNATGVEALAGFVKSAKAKTFSYVLSTYYLDVLDETGKVQRRYGVVVDSDGQLGGLDITTADSAKTHVTSPHSLLVNKDKSTGKTLLQAIQELEKNQSK
jgi:hypothetical protein